MSIILAVLQAIAAVPKIGEMIERITLRMGEFFAERAYRKQVQDVDRAAEMSRRALTKEEIREALDFWRRARS